MQRQGGVKRGGVANWQPCSPAGRYYDAPPGLHRTQAHLRLQGPVGGPPLSRQLQPLPRRQLSRWRALAQRRQQLCQRPVQHAGPAAAGLPGRRANCCQQERLQWRRCCLLRDARCCRCCCCRLGWAGGLRSARMQGNGRALLNAGPCRLPVMSSEAQPSDQPTQSRSPAGTVCRARTAGVGAGSWRAGRGRGQAHLQHPQQLLRAPLQTGSPAGAGCKLQPRRLQVAEQRECGVGGGRTSGGTQPGGSLLHQVAQRRHPGLHLQ